MSVAVKICGITTPEALQVAMEAGADYVGFVFYPPSPRALDVEAAKALAASATRVKRVGVFVDPDDDLLARVMAHVPLDLIQLHGSETPDRVAAVREQFNRRVIKAVPLAGRDDLEAAGAYQHVADFLLFDAKPPKSMADALPGGNALRFDWEILRGVRVARPWFLSGGLDAAVVGEAIRVAGAPGVDVSSGVEDRPGVKSPAKIRAFLKAAKMCDPQ
ncbi:MAG: phosphoribosylanthranilate isomerase [Alphaproteobacteria bacterium]|nr:MAG: phosphoribosylanthranilate isomerase [Alphaproteobacteria bacterium]